MTDRVLLDSNVLIAAIDSSRQGHLLAQSLIESDPRALSVTGQNLREFLSALTRPTSANGYGAPGDRAVADWAEITSTMEFMDETPGSRQLLTSFVSDGKATGKVQMFAPGEAVLPEERIGIEQEDGSEEASVGYAAGLGDKQGQHDWYLVRDDDAAITLHVDAISGDERPTEKEVREVGTLLGAPELDSLLDEVAAG